jgi:two-component system, NarL family, nitrate/nitrite response regulator NarL
MGSGILGGAAMRVRVYLVGKDGRRRPSVTRALVRGVETITVVGSHTDPAVAAEALTEHAPDVVLLDWRGSGAATAAAVACLRAAGAPPVLVLSERERPEDLARLLKAGARGVVSRRPDALHDALRAVAVAGGIVLDPARTEALLGHLGVLPDPEPDARLTAREQEVLDRLCRGETYEGVASRLGIGLGTVQSHVKSIYRKLSVDSKTAAARAARARGLGAS